MKRGVLSQHTPFLAYEKKIVNLLFAIVSEL